MIHIGDKIQVVCLVTNEFVTGTVCHYWRQNTIKQFMVEFELTVKVNGCLKHSQLFSRKTGLQFGVRRKQFKVELPENPDFNGFNYTGLQG